MPKIDMTQVRQRKGSGYPAPFHEMAKDRITRALGDAGGLADFGVNLVTLPPGNWSSQRHWHSAEDEFVYVLSGELALITDAGEQRLAAGECAAFPKGVADGHHLINRGKTDAVFLAIGTRSADDECRYPDIDLFVANRIGHFTHRDGTPYPPR
jgi:uncharacterized cupin superfamily protein